MAHRKTFKTSLAAAAGLLALALAACSQEAQLASLVGKPVDNFLLVDHEGLAETLKYNKNAPAVVLVAQVNGDEGSRAAAKALAALKEKYPTADIKMINSSIADTREAIAEEAKAQGFTIPVLDDEFQLIGDSIGFTYAGEAVAIDPKTWTIAYHGPVEAKDGGLDAALAAMSAGQPVAVAHAPVKGAKIEFPDRGRQAEWANISYEKEVAPILLERCVDCHQPGGIGPFHMTSYEVVKGFGPMIREAIRTDRMPPYDVDRHVGVFANDENLTEAETKTLIRWIEAGAPRGTGEDPLAKGVTQRPDWPLGEPDLVVDIPAYTIPASGIVDYQVPAVKSPLTEGKWLKATTFKAGERQGVHHILAGWVPQMPKPGDGFNWDINMGGYAVGSESNLAPENWGTWVPAGGAINFQMHYTPFGKEAVDKSKIGFYFMDEAPELVKRQIVIADPTLTIQPNTSRHHERGYVQFPAAVQITAAQPHAHYRGYASKLTAVLPDGTEKVILNMPKYDFNWQREYIYKDLIDLPAGTKLVADYWYDNSELNAANPDPNALVKWGDQSFEEMLFTAVQFRWVDETATNRRDDLQKQLEDAQLFTAVDDNLDGKWQQAEVKGDMLEPLKANFAAFDGDKDAALSPQEVGAAMQQMQRAAAGRSGGAGGQR
jgi:mono/diheme cytochrome c family protein